MSQPGLRGKRRTVPKCRFQCTNALFLVRKHSLFHTHPQRLYCRVLTAPQAQFLGVLVFKACGGSILCPETGPWRGQIASNLTFLGPGALRTRRAGEDRCGTACTKMRQDEPNDRTIDPGENEMADSSGRGRRKWNQTFCPRSGILRAHGEPTEGQADPRL